MFCYFCAAFLWLLLFSSCQDAFYVFIFWCCDNLKRRLWYAEELKPHRICDCEAKWRLSIYEWLLTAGERWTAGFSLLSFLRLLSPSLGLFSPPPQVSVRHPIVRDIQPQCENQQMGNFVCMVSVDVCECVWRKKVGEGELRSRE